VPSQYKSYRFPPIRAFAASVIKKYVLQVVGIRPGESFKPHEVSNFGCGCADCASVRAFLEGPRLSMTIAVAQSRRQHLQTRLNPLSGLGITHQEGRIGRPYPLTIQKSNTFTSSAQWRRLERPLAEMLATLGSSEDQYFILGEDSATIMPLVGLPPAITISKSGPSGDPAPASRPPKKVQKIGLNTKIKIMD